MMLAVQNSHWCQPVNQPVLTVPSTLPPVNSITHNIRSIRNFNVDCVKISDKDKSYDPVSHGHGRKIDSIRTSFAHGISSLKKYSISINTEAYTELGESGKKGIRKALGENAIEFVSGSWVNKKDTKALRFNLSKDTGDYRVELAHRNGLNMNTDSMYEFEMRAGYAAHDVIFFQVKETGGNMKDEGGGRPPVSLHLRNEKEIHIAMNSENGNVLRKKIATLTCKDGWYKYKVRIVWNRDHPSVQVAINGKSVFEERISFGAHNSKNHYSKFGIYVPQQKEKEGVKSTSFLFDNVKESHRLFKPNTRHNKVIK